MTRDDALHVVDQVYAAAHGEVEWQEPLTLLADVLNHSAATIEFHDVEKGGLLAMQSARIDPSSIDIYKRDYARLNPRVDFLRKSDRPVVFDQLILDEGQMDRNPFYADFLKPWGLRYFMAFHTPVIDKYAKGIVTLQRPGKTIGLDQDALTLFEGLSPHLKRALAVYWQRQISQIDPGYLDRALAGFGLTAAERRLARGLAFGETPPEYGRRTGLSMNTVYTHFRRIKGKLDCRRQSDLVARLYEIAGREV